MHEEEQSVREQTNLLHKRSKGKRLMNNFDQITRRDFLSRVTTLAGGVVVATSAGLLAGCGSDNGSSSSTTKVVPFPSQPAAPTPLTPQQAIQLAISQGFLPANTQITATTPITTLDTTNTSASAVAGLIAANLPSPGVFLLPSLSSFTTGQSLQLTPAQLMAGIQTYLSQAGITFSAGDKIENLSYTINGQPYNSIAVVDANGKILFDTYASLLPPTSSSATTQTNASNNYSTNALGQARYTAYNPADGHLLLDAGFTAKPNYDVNGNLSQTNPVTVAQAPGTGSAGPGIKLAAQSPSLKERPHDTITNTTLSVTITIGLVTTVIILSVTVDIATAKTTITTVLVLEQFFAGILLWALVVVVVVTINNATGGH
jgi:hypothetical protein